MPDNEKESDNDTDSHIESLFNMKMSARSAVVRALESLTDNVMPTPLINLDAAVLFRRLELTNLTSGDGDQKHLRRHPWHHQRTDAFHFCLLFRRCEINRRFTVSGISGSAGRGFRLQSRDTEGHLPAV